MSAGATQKQKTGYTYRMLKSTQRELSKAGVSSTYEKATATHYAVLIHTQGSSPIDGGFNITQTWGNMSNGGSVGTSRIYLVYKGKSETYEGWGYQCDGGFSKGMERIKELFATQL